MSPNNIFRQAPQTYFWETMCAQDEQPSRILSCLLENNPFAKPGTSLLVIPTNKAEILYPSLLRFSEYLGQGLYRDTTGINIIDADGSSSQHPLFFHAADHMPILFLGGDGKEKVRITLEKGLYKKRVAPAPHSRSARWRSLGTASQKSLFFLLSFTGY